MTKLNKINVEVQVEKKVDNRANNTGRPINKKSARQVRLAKQAYYTTQNAKFINGHTFSILNNSNIHKYECNFFHNILVLFIYTINIRKGFAFSKPLTYFLYATLIYDSTTRL